MSTKSARLPKNLDPEGVLCGAIASQVAKDGLELDRRELKPRGGLPGADMLSRMEAALVDAPLTVKGAQNQLVSPPADR